jgi:hypothetical protein
LTAAKLGDFINIREAVSAIACNSKQHNRALLKKLFLTAFFDSKK